jgi:secondary thiamine-phosphate synthase enzyme
MPVFRLTIQTDRREAMIDITAQVRRVVEESGVREGVATVFCPHTTAAMTINENADPDVQRDILLFTGEAVPESYPGFRHGEGNSDAHIKASLFGSSVQVIVSGGRLMLGTWQGVYFCEFDGPRRREAWVSVMGDGEE